MLFKFTLKLRWNRTVSLSLRCASSSIRRSGQSHPAALLGMRSDGSANAWAVLRDLAARPS